MGFRFAVLAAAASAAAETLSYSRVHFMDSVGKNLLFRSNIPVITLPDGSSAFAYANLTQFMAERAVQEGGVTFPSQFYLHIYSFNNIFDVSETQYEIDFFKANPTLGAVTFWPLLGQLEPPAWVNASTRAYYVNNQTALWGVDQLPSRLATLRAQLEIQGDLPVVYLVHCTAGCDRTGEFSASYYMTYLNMNVTGAWDRDVTDCGRAPDYWSKNAIQWYCLTYEAESGNNIGDCINW